MAEHGYFAPDSTIRRIGGESVLMLGGGRALLMQAAHPLVAEGIVSHSGYAENPWRRLARTMGALYTVVYGTRAEADRAGAAVRAVHKHVRGRARDGRRYSAGDPALQLWVHATLVDTGLVMHDTFVRRLRAREREAFYDEMKTVARVFGVPERVLPESLADFEAYLAGMLAGPELAIGEAARAVARVVLSPPAPLPLRATFETLGSVSVTLLPPELRERYGLHAGRVHRTLLAASSHGVRRALPLLPGPLRRVRDERRTGLPLAVLERFAA